MPATDECNGTHSQKPLEFFQIVWRW